jgi:hypothetical protein
MAQLWYLARDGKKDGPLTSNQLRELAASGSLRPDEFVYSQADDLWREARLIKGLFDDHSTVTPAPDRRNPGRPDRTAARIDPAIALERLRDRLSRHARAISHHGIDDLGREIEVRAARRIPIYRIAWTTLFERREVVERRAPHDGSKAYPPAKITIRDLDPWTVQLPSPAEFADGSSESPVDGSESVHGCDQCRSAGRVICDGCQGQRAVACDQCGGGGMVRCGSCSGTGRTYQIRSEQRTKICSATTSILASACNATCRGGWTEKGPCRTCNGTGVEHYIHKERYPVPCVTCSAQGQHACRTCGGGRIVACPKCAGHGQLTCPSCQGHKRIVQYLAVARSHEAKEEMVTVPCEDCPEEAVRGLDLATEFGETLSRSSIGPPVDASLDSKLHVLDGPIRVLRGKVQAQGGGDRRRVGDRLHITEAQVIRLDYTFEGKEYTAWFSGEVGPVHAPESPITEVAARHIEDALAAWKEGRQKDAIRALRPAVAMSKKSPECRAVLEAKSPRIPEELMRRASAFSLSWTVGNFVEEFWRGLGFGPPKRATSPAAKAGPAPGSSPLPGSESRSVEPKKASTDRPERRPWYCHPLVLGMTTLFLCFPVTLLLVWRKNGLSLRTKWIWSGVSVGFFLFAMAMGAGEVRAVREELDRAETLWAAGSRAEAVEIYRPIVRDKLGIVEESRRASVTGRLIDFEVESGREAEARQLIEVALPAGVTPSVQGERAKQLLSEVQAARAGEAASAARRATASPTTRNGGGFERSTANAYAGDGPAWQAGHAWYEESRRTPGSVISNMRSAGTLTYGAVNNAAGMTASFKGYHDSARQQFIDGATAAYWSHHD